MTIIQSAHKEPITLNKQGNTNKHISNDSEIARGKYDSQTHDVSKGVTNCTTTDDTVVNGTANYTTTQNATPEQQ